MSSLVSESDVLKPLLPAHLAENYETQWPVFELTNAIVTDKDGSIVNLFSASEQNLLVVSGELVQKKEQSSQYKSGIRKRSIFVEVKPVGRYAFGSNERGNIQIWAAGRSGWFELEPSLEYVTTHAEMTEAVCLWHEILDNTKLQNSTGKDVFVPFLRKKNRTRTPEDVFRTHAGFLIEQMNKELTSWSRKPLYRYLVKLQNGLGDALDTTPIEPPQIMTARTRELKRRGRPPKVQAVEKPKTPPKKTKAPRTPVDDLKRIETEAAVLWKFIQHGSETVHAARPEVLTMKAAGYMVHHTFAFDKEEQAISYIRFQGPYLLKVMQQRRQQRIWAHTPFYNALLDTVLTPSLVGKMAKIVLQVRDYELGGEMAKGGLDVYASSDEDVQPHQTKSALRPKSAGKSKGKASKGKSYTANTELNDEQLSPSSRTIKRKAQDIEDGVRRSKRNRTESISLLTDDSSSAEEEQEEEEDAEAAGSITATSDDDEQTADKILPLRWKTTNPKTKPDEDEELHPPTIVKGVKLDVTPNAPGDVWHCTALGCMQTIYGASGPLGSRLIDEHVYEHQAREDGAPQYSVVMNETKKTNLPVSNLIKRIRELAAAKDLADAVAGAERNGDL